MKDSYPIVDDRLIDDLVTGQLTGEPYRTALRALDAEPTKWRDCAIAFLEDQALRTDLGTLAKGTIAWTTEAEPARDSARLVDSKANNEHRYTVQAASRTARSTSDDLAAHRFRSGLLSTVALLLVSFSLGWLGSDLTANPAAPTIRSAPQSSVAQIVTPKSAGPEQFVFDRADSYLPLDREVPHSLRELERQGKIRIESQDGIVQAIMEDGSPALIPVQEYRLRPATWSY